MAGKTKSAPGVPEVLAVRRDRSHRGPRTAGREVSASPSDVLSVYLRGGPRYRLGQRTYEFAAPVAMLVPEGVVDDDRQEGRVDGIYVLFRSHGLLRRRRIAPDQVSVRLGRQQLAVPQLKPLSTRQGHELAQRLAEMKSVRGIGTVQAMRTSAMLLEAVSDYCEAGGASGPRVHREAARLRELIEAHAFDTVSLAQICQGMDYSTGHIETLFKRAFGITPVAYRMNLRLHRARELLMSSQLNASQAAEAVGFADPLYFSRVFRKIFGVTPSSLIRDFSSRRR